jgi:hypothetical protein
MERKVNFGILFNLLKGRGPFAIIGIVFTTLSIFVFIPLLLILPGALMHSYEKYDFKEIEKNGIEKVAKVTDLKLVSNVSVNYEHPKIVGYQYENSGQLISDKFETLDLDKITNVNVGSEITILVYQNQSMIKGLTPFSFPIHLFYLFPGIFLTIGIPFLLIGFIPALRTFNLYKTGVVKDAYVVSMSLNSIGIFPVRSARQNILVNYYFWDDFKNKIFGESTTTDYLILNEKKEGDLIKIFVSESDENKNVLIPRLEAVKYNWAI